MIKLFKKTAAIVFAATIAAAIGANAYASEIHPVMSDTWSVAGVALEGAPAGTGKNDSCYMVYSTDGIEVYCNKVSNWTNGGSGKVTITCTNDNATMAPVTLTNTGERVICNPSVSGAVKGIFLFFTASASSGNVYEASGTAYTIKKV